VWPYLLAHALDELVGEHVGGDVVRHKSDEPLEQHVVLGKIVEAVLHPLLQHVQHPTLDGLLQLVHVRRVLLGSVWLLVVPARK
jgi:hypothetical protein